ncbi:F510_1955 family glycosylhydrolase [Actinomadura sp. 6N118]
MSRTTRRSRRATLAVSLTATVSLVLAACGGDDTTSTTASSPAGADPGIGHIHGLGVDPADGAIYVAAHYGVFRIIGQDRAARVAGRFQDTMGFTIVGPKTFLASGHPAAAEMAKGARPHLGLLRSADAGATWTEVSEGGSADFHGLQPAGTKLYAFDSQTGQVRRSDDEGRKWIIGARLQVVDLAAHRNRPDRVHATTPEGVQVSDDGGATFTKASGTPLLSHLDAVDGGGLVGVGVDGQVHSGRPGDGSWQRLGRLPGGQATAFTAVDARRLLAATEDGSVHESRDGGRSFTMAYRPAPN